MHITMARLYEAAKATRNIEAPSDLARELNTSPQTIFNWSERGVSKSGQLTVQRLLGVSATWLATGRGPMLLPLAAQQDSGDQGQGLPLVQWDDLALDDTLAVACQHPRVRVNTGRTHSSRSFAVRIPTNVMEPTIPQGSIIVVDASLPAALDDHVLVRMPDVGEVLLRQIIDQHLGQPGLFLAAAANRRPILDLARVNMELLGVATQVVLDLAPLHPRRTPCLLRKQKSSTT